MDLKYLKMLANLYPNSEAVATEIINLSAINCLPKGTEFFFSDIHGEYEAFLYLLRSASGEIKNKIDQEFSKLVPEQDREQLAYLICYPDQVLSRLNYASGQMTEWKRITMNRLVHICKVISSKYTRSKVRKNMLKEFAYIFDEFLNVADDVNLEYYYKKIIDTILDIQIEDNFILAICQFIRNLSIDRLHLIGDIYDRGPRADIIFEELQNLHDVDIQWGNHDISWMGAASGNRALIANVIRLAISYNNFDLLEDGYGINLRALSVFAAETYKEDNCSNFIPFTLDYNEFDPVDLSLAAKMHKAITIIQLKLEGQLIERHQEYEMSDRIFLKNIDAAGKNVTINGVKYPLKDALFPTLNPDKPLELTKEEENLMEVLAHSFENSNLLHKHVRFLFANGSMYKCFNGNLLYHGCIPMNENGEFLSITYDGKEYGGKELLDFLDHQVNKAYFGRKHGNQHQDACDFMWYLWCGSKSPLFGKSKLAMFENYFIYDEEAKVEKYNAYFHLSQDEMVCKKILKEFGLDEETSHIINGHVPVKTKDGENPVRANGRLINIDGGLSKAYQTKTGIAGYTLIYNSHSLSLAEHKSFNFEFDKVISPAPKIIVVESMGKRILVGETDNGKLIQEKIDELRELLKHFRNGSIKEKK